MRDRRQTMKDCLPMRNASFRAMAVSVLAMLSLLPGVLVVQPVRAQTPKVVIDCLPPWETNNRFLESTKIKHPGLSLNGFDCDDNCDIGYGLKQVLEKVYGYNQDTRVRNIFGKIIKQYNEPLLPPTNKDNIFSNTIRLQSRGFVALAAYVLENNDYDPTILNPALPSAHVAVSSFRAALRDSTSWKINTKYEDDGIKWTTPLTNIARAIDFYLALENAYKHYDTIKYLNTISKSILSNIEKTELMSVYTSTIIELEFLRYHRVRLLTFDRYNKEPGNAPLVMQLAIGYAILTRQNGDYPWLKSHNNRGDTYISHDDLLSYIKRAFKAGGAEAGTDRHKHWNYQSDDGKYFWAEGPYYFQLTLSKVIPFWHAVRINKLLSHTDVHNYTFFDPFFNDRFTRPLHWLADLSTPDGKTPPLDDGNKRIIYNVNVLSWNHTYGNYSVGKKFAWIGTKIDSASFRKDLYPVEIAIPPAEIPSSNPLEPIIGNSFANRKSGDAGNNRSILSDYGRQEVVVRREIAGHTHYILLNGESGDAIERGEGHEQGDQLQLLYYIDDTSYLVDSGYDTAAGLHNSTWNHYNDHNVMTLDPDHKQYSSADGGVRDPTFWTAKRRIKSEHQRVDEIYQKTYENIDLLSAKMTLNASPKGAFGIVLNYQAFAHYYRNVLFIRDSNQPYLIDINAVSGDNYNRTNWYDMLYHVNSNTTYRINRSHKGDNNIFVALRWNNIYKSEEVKSPVHLGFKTPLIIQPFTVERPLYFSQKADKIRESYISATKGIGVPIKKLELHGNNQNSAVSVSTSKKDFTTLSFIRVLSHVNGIKYAKEHRSLPEVINGNRSDRDWQYYTWQRDSSVVDIVVSRKGKYYANPISSSGFNRTSLHFPVPQADSFYVELPQNMNYGFARIVKDKSNNIWNIDPKFQLNLKKSIPQVTISGPSCIGGENSTGYYFSSASGGKPPYSYYWSFYRFCPDGNSDSISSSSLGPVCNSWNSIGIDQYTEFGGYNGEDFKIRLTLTDRSSPQQSATSSELPVQLLSSTEGSCMNDQDPVGKLESQEPQPRISNTSLSEGKESIPDAYALRPNFPNPFNPSTEILFDLPETAMVLLVVYDVLGREVARLVEGELAAGWHGARFDAGNLSSGVYLYRIQAGNFQDTGRMLLLK